MPRRSCAPGTTRRPTFTWSTAPTAAVTERLDLFREDWWAVYGNADLTNRWVRIKDQAAGLPVVELSRWRKGAIQIASALYEPTERTVSLVSRDGQHFELPTGSGGME